MAGGRLPIATYRLQFTPRFRLDDARELVPYLQALGISDLYASPLLQARRGSVHGYDTTDPTRINPELGGDEAFRALAEALRERGMGLLLDIVPNHMAASAENPWWRDVLEHGRDSPYARYFDVEWQPSRAGLADRVVLPILGAPYGQVLENGELRVALDADGLAVRYYEWRLPLRPGTYGLVLAAAWGGRRGPSALGALVAALEGAATRDAAAWEQARARLWEQYEPAPDVRAFVDETLAELNGQPGEPASFDRLDALLEEQAYRLAYWRVASHELNYRRFFDISDLVSVRVEDPTVFAATHGAVLRLAATGLVTGLRIDHVDGLYDPAAYLERLQAHLPAQADGAAPAPRFYVVVEKILSGDEALPESWPVEGTTGYDFLNEVNGLFVDGRAAASLDDLYRRVSGGDSSFADVAHARKRYIVESLFAGEARALAELLGRLAQRSRYGRDLPLAELEQAIVEVAACLPVYRTYVRDARVSATDRAYVEQAVAAARERRPALGPACAFLQRVLLLEWPAAADADEQAAWLHFVMRWQQFTGPATAKGVEDTALYCYTRLLSLNDVGGEPSRTGLSVAEFHQRQQARRARWPHTLNATSTHDTKRSEDVRARINVLSEIPRAWAAHLAHWREWNAPKREQVGDLCVPDGPMELLIYQSLLGAWPLDETELPTFGERFRGYLEKASREVKTHTSWHHPNADYEQALFRFAEAILAGGDGTPFLADFRALQRAVAYYGALNSLGQVLLKATAPGAPDFYQGTELWDLSLVDPDNRRPVDYAKRAALLAALPDPRGESSPALAYLLDGWPDGRVKLYLTREALRCRQEHPALFAAGDYQPLAVRGPRAEHVCAFTRHHAGTTVLVVVPRLLARLAQATRGVEALATEELPPLLLPVGESIWGDTALSLPAAGPRRWRNALSDEQLGASEAAASSSELRLGEVLRGFPVVLLVSEG